MKVAATACPEAPAAAESLPRAEGVGVRLRAADYLELTKPRIALMVLVTVAVGYLLGAGADARAAALFHV
ncbi:MAG TPA: hypothetical protein VIL46_04415, partial [Gemmataceae bacterium]